MLVNQKMDPEGMSKGIRGRAQILPENIERKNENLKRRKDPQRKTRQIF